MENRRNYYRILQVQPGAPVEIVRASYRTLMQRLRAHPDLGGDHHKAALINEAYAVLSDAVRRADYDRQIQARLQDARHDMNGGEEVSTAARRGDSACLFCGTRCVSRPGGSPDACCRTCGSPLQPATVRQLSGSGRRAMNRVPRDYPLQLFTTWPQAHGMPARSRDVSLDGISFVTQELLEPRAVVKIDSDVCRAVVRIANLRVDADSGSWLVGAQFLSVLFARPRGAFLSTLA